MSLIVLPSRGQCIQTTDNGHHCQCLWFLPPKSSQLDPSQDICGWCKHSIHAHADYVSTVIDNYPANQCTVYAQETRLMQYCTCGAQFFEHVTTYNLYYISDPWTVLHYFNPDNNVPSPSAAMSGYSNDASSPFSPDTTSFVYSTAILSGDARNVSFTPAPTYSPSASSSISPTIQPDATQNLHYSPGGYVAQPSNHFVDSPYAGQPEGCAMNQSFEYQDYENAIYAEPPEDWSGSSSA
ncbi:hypothetical protein EDD18DRAFT_1365215 [Armillaria luteobubalina]|uniref:Uncharacterized protein n=1 Tax=Armillaria luteobubalina TaxID=153913 RepID=A0AA39P546_9AGAR|nr:hypothetical protein EDD18DRAFT_1365215 [Armillaria luteobubalina]